MKTIELDKVTSYRVQTTEGPLLMEHKTSWNGLMELVDAKGRKLVVSPEGSTFMQMFGDVFGGITGDIPKASIMLASPGLAAILLVAGDGGPANEAGAARAS